MTETERRTPPNQGGDRIDLPPAYLPAPTYWPALLALGTAFLAWGLVTSLIISAVGLCLFTAALVGWIGELRHDHV
ncbi:MAG: hypothetical protein R2932_13760 [Caldilineaceae bacterium]